jgi:hypothetical protein
MEQDIDAGVEVPEVPELPQVQDGQQDTTDWKAVAQERQEALTKMQGMTKRFQTKLKKLGEAPKPQADAQKPAANQASKGFDYGQLAYLNSLGVSHAEDQAFVEGLVKESGVELKDLLGKAWVQSELKERQAVRATAEATPKGGKRAGNQSNDQVDYWIQQGKLPPDSPENRELRRQVVNARIKADKAQSTFAGQSVVQ